jgi:hypothetical protein
MTTIPCADPERVHLPETGIFVRALDLDGKFDAIDISHLTKESLLAWLRDKKPVFVEGVVLVLLGHSRGDR